MTTNQYIKEIVNNNFQITQTFNYIDQTWPTIERSDENIHDDYTPLYIKRLNNDTVTILKTNSEFCLFHDLIKFAINKFCRPEGDKVESVIPTKNGYHLITDRFDVMEFAKHFPKTEIQKKNPTLLYLPNSLN